MPNVGAAGQKYGLILPPIAPEDFVFGDQNIVTPPLQPDGQWVDYLPPDEFQNMNGIETFACASFGTLNALEILLRRVDGSQIKYADRYLAKISGTQYAKGNSPQTVAEILRNQGAIEESLWPFGPDITTFQLFYATPPAELNVTAKQFNYSYLFNHDYVPNDPQSMKLALTFSPIAMSVSAWTLLPNGLYAAGDGINDNHWVACYGYEDGVSWHVFDSYDSTHKKVEWAHKPVQVKRYSIQVIPPPVPTTDPISVPETIPISLYQSLIATLEMFIAYLKSHKKSTTV